MNRSSDWLLQAHQMPSVLEKYSDNGANLWKLNTKAAISVIKNSVQRPMHERPDVAKVILFGSLADGTAVPVDDPDILIVLFGSGRRKWLDRIDEFSPYLDDIGISADIFPYTIEEAERIPLARKAFEHCIVLVERACDLKLWRSAWKRKSAGQ